MTVSHEGSTAVKKQSAMEKLHEFLAQRQASTQPVADLESFEKELHELFTAAEAEVVAEELGHLDVDVPELEIDGERYCRAVRCEETYVAASGTVRVMRTLYRSPARDDRCLCPMELRAGIVEGRWTPLAAKTAMWVVAHMTPYEGEELFARVGGMKPSKSSLQRFPEKLSEQWEKGRNEFEEALRVQERIPQEVVGMAVSLDGVMVPMRDGHRTEKRSASVAHGKSPQGPAGYREAGCATLSFYDKEGQRLSTVRFARMPEKGKTTLKQMLTAEVEMALIERPDLKIGKVADGAADNWSYLSKSLPKGAETVDFYHATEHLHDALAAAHGEFTPKCSAEFERLRVILRDESRGVHKVIRALRHLSDTYPRRKTIKKELKYFGKNRRRMKYAQVKAMGLPIGSGVTEAACKTLVTQRLKRSGMRWATDGGQAILTFRSLVQSDRFDRGWQMLADVYKRTVKLPKNVVPMDIRNHGRAVSM
jgi:hypothetical protein